MDHHHDRYLAHDARNPRQPTHKRTTDPRKALLPQLPEAGYTTGFATDDSRFSYMIPETGFEMIRQPVVGLQNCDECK